MMPNDLDKRVYADFAANHLTRQFLNDMLENYKTSKDMIYEKLNSIIEEFNMGAESRGSSDLVEDEGGADK